MWRLFGRWTSSRTALVLLPLALLTSAGCGLAPQLDRLRKDYVAQAQIGQAKAQVAAGGDFQRAHKLAERALQLKPDSLPVIRTAAAVFLRTGAWEQGLQTLEEYESRAGAVSLYEKGMACLYAGREAEGTRLLESYLADQRSLRAVGQIDDESLAWTLNNVGYVYADAGVHLTRALELTRAALRLRWGSPAIADSVAWAYYRLARYDEAAFHVEQAVRLMRPPDAVLLYHAGAVHARQGRLILAENELRRALKLQRHFPEARYELERLHWQLPPPQRV